MKYIFLIILSISTFLSSCAEKEVPSKSLSSSPIDILLEVPNIFIEDSLLRYDNQKSQWTFNGELFSGYAVQHYQDRILKIKMGILNGKKQSQSNHWYPDGHLKMVANYQNGKLHGEKKTWSSDSSHVLLSQLNYHLGKAHGEQKKWYVTGQLFKKLNLNMGKEEGMQKAFRKNGALFANYEAKKGRIFGLKKAALCFGLEDEIVKYEK